MTSLSVWASVDTHGVSAIYLTSDSRISWGNSSVEHWDFATKLFYCRNSADIFGYSGSSLAIVKILSQITAISDTNGLFTNASSANEKINIFSDLIKNNLKSFPSSQLGGHISTIIHCSQTMHKRPNPLEFAIRSITFESKDIKNNSWIQEDHIIPNSSDLIGAWGSGAKNIKNTFEIWKKSDSGGTSRAVFSSIVDAISNTQDPFTGGAPQLLGMYRYHLPKMFGIIYKDKLYVNGLEITPQKWLANIEWRNENFEICDWETRKRKPKAQHQPRPKTLK